jgi:plasmid stabilization system protein ParE
METDIAKVLSYEIKKELADRYFGFRKLIEEDKEDLAREIHLSSVNIENKIVQDLARLYILFNDEQLIQKFLELIGLDERMFFDPYLLESPTIKAKLFSEIKRRGLTKAGRFKNLVIDCYELLVEHVEIYRETYAELLESREIIEEEIKLFYQKNDIGSILDFLRNLDGPEAGSSSLQTVPQTGFSENIAQKMLIQPPAPIDRKLAIIPPLVPLPQIKSSLKSLAEQAFDLHGNDFKLS